MIQPVNSSTMFFSEPLSNPNNCNSIKPCSICQYLTEMSMVSFFKLVFN